ncbi:MAG: hypothetical protein AABX33_01055 [Nanoarchaeota archaeon]
MRVDINQKYLSLNRRLAKESNKIAGNFSNRDYSKIENIDDILLARDISIEKKKKILINKLHYLVIETFSIDKNKFSKAAFHALKKRLSHIRKIITRLRSINYYLETTFLEELNLSKIMGRSKDLKVRRQKYLTKAELEALEYAAYSLIREAAVLDKQLLGEYFRKEKRILGKEITEIKDFESILGKESEILEHMEAKLPPPKAASINLMKEPVFTHWVVRIFTLMSCLGYLWAREASLFAELKKNNTAKTEISKKISHLMKERLKLLGVLEEKGIALEKFEINDRLKKELHNVNATIGL